MSTAERERPTAYLQGDQVESSRDMVVRIVELDLRTQETAATNAANNEKREQKCKSKYHKYFIKIT